MVEVVAAADECTAVLQRRVPAAHARAARCELLPGDGPRGRARPGLRGEGRPGAAVLGGGGLRGCWAGAGRRAHCGSAALVSMNQTTP